MKRKKDGKNMALKTVACKEVDEDQKLIEEIKILQKMRHPHIIS